MPNPTTAEEWAAEVLAEIDALDTFGGCPASQGIDLIVQAIDAYAAQQTAALKETHEIDVINGEAWAERAREAERERDALRAVAKAAQVFAEKFARLQKAISGAFVIQQIHGIPYRGENYGEEWTVLQDALAHPDVLRAVKEGP